MRQKDHGRKRKNLLFVMLAVLLSTAARAPCQIPSAFVDIGYGARPAGMGGAYVALASDPHAVIWNPACLPYVKGWQISGMYAKQFNIIPYTLFAGARGLDDRFGFGCSILTSGDDALRENTFLAAAGVRLSVLTPALANFALGLTVKVRTASFGNNPDGGEDRIQGSASGYGLDLGLRWKFAYRWTLGLLYRDAWNTVSYDNETRNATYNEAVPSALILGTAFLAHSNLVFTMDWDKALNDDMRDRIAAGVEWRLFRLIFIRGGWSQSFDLDPNRKWNWGLGLQYFRTRFGIRFDFAYQVHFLAATPRISTSIWF